MSLHENATKADSLGNKDGTNCQYASLLKYLNPEVKKIQQEKNCKLDP
jgi:hypothetical protein